MALSLETFLERFPEFDKTTEALVEAKLAEALLQIHAPTWGDKADLGQGYLAAAMLAQSQRGLNSRLQSDQNRSTYQDQFDRLRSSVAYGPILIKRP